MSELIQEEQNQKVENRGKNRVPSTLTAPPHEKRMEILLNLRAKGSKFQNFTNDQLLYLTDPATLLKTKDMTRSERIEEFRNHFKLKEN